MARNTATAAARSAPRRSPPRRSARRVPPRRVSGPVPGAGGAVAIPGRVLRAPFARAARARAGGVLDALLQGRAWIALVAVLLVGIVFFNVDLLELNRDIAHTSEKASRLNRENARLRLQVARLASSERIQGVAARRGLELPAPGEVRYLRFNPFADAHNAAAFLTEPGSGSATPVASGTPASGPASSPSPPVTAPAAPTTPPAGAQAAPTTTSPSSPPAATPPPTGAPTGPPTGGAAPSPTAPTAGGTGG